MKKLLLLPLILLSMVSCTTKNDTSNADFQWQIDRFDDVKILQYKVNNFENLSLDQKTLIYYLSQAAVCGRDILFDQNFKYNLPIRKTLETLYTSFKGDKTTQNFKNFEMYLKKVWFANGIHHHYSNDKFTPAFTEAYFSELVAAAPSGKLLPKAEIEFIKRIIFEPKLYAKRTNLSPDEDLVLTSTVNFYDGVTQSEAEAFYNSMVDEKDAQPVSYGLNSTLVKQNGVITEKVWKVGGVYDKAIVRIVGWLEKAATVAENDHQRKSIEKLISYYKSGNLREFDQYNIMWVKDSVSSVDFVNGFTENYTDPLGRKATWESIVNFRDDVATMRATLISDNAQWFEDNSPVAAHHKKKKVKGVSAKVITAAMLGGDCYPATPIGINLPNADWIRRDYGSKSVTIANITQAYEQSSNGNGFADEFILLDQDKEIKSKWGAVANDLNVDLHECLGHGSGQLMPGVKGDELRNYGSTLEEARADLFALYYIADPKLVEVGIMPSMDVAKAEYLSFMLNGVLTQLNRIDLGKNIEESHMRDRALIANWAYEKGKADNVVEIVTKNHKSYIKINDYTALRKIFGEMLAEIQRIKSEGDFKAGGALVEQYAVRVDPVVHKQIKERFAKLDIAPYSGFVNPRYEAIEEDGAIVDVVVHYDGNYVNQMLDYSTNYSFL